MSILGNIYVNLGRYAEAVKLHEDALAISRKLGPARPHTLSIMANLANVYDSMGRHSDALGLREETLALAQTTLGPDHSFTLLCMTNLGDSYRRVGRAADALELYRKLLPLATAKHGADNELTLTCRATVASCLVQLGLGAEAAANVLQDAEAWERLGRSDAIGLYNAACFRAIAAGALRSAARSPEGAEKARAQADRAMAWLERAVAAGFRDVARIAIEHDFEALRDREDFKRLLAEMKGNPAKKSERALDHESNWR
jgi:tetratricopeptide (TPR) repeat protein